MIARIVGRRSRPSWSSRDRRRVIARASRRCAGRVERSANCSRSRHSEIRNRVSGGMASRGCAWIISDSRVVPERGQPTTKTGRSLLTGGRLAAGRRRAAGCSRRTVVRMSISGSRGLPTLASELRTRDDDALAALLRARPDLLSPVPSDISSLAARATTRPSVQRALDQLDRFTLQVLEVLAVLPEPGTDTAVQAALGAEPGRPLAELHRQALVYRTEDGGLLVPRAVLDAVGQPAGLGPAAEHALQTYGPRRLSRLASDLGLDGLEPHGDPIRTT